MQTTTLNQNRHQNKKVSFLVSCFPPSFIFGGGVSKRYGRTVEAFGNLGYETHVLTCISNPTMYKNMTYHKFPSINVLGYDCMNILDNLSRIQRIIKGSDMLFVDDTPFGSIVCCMANKMGIRAIRTNHTHAVSFFPMFLIKLNDGTILEEVKEEPFRYQLENLAYINTMFPLMIIFGHDGSKYVIKDMHVGVCGR